MAFPNFANELLILVAEGLGQKDLNHLLQVNRHLAGLLTPLLDEFAVEDKDGLTALQWASTKGHEPLAKMVIERGADVNARNESEGKTALHLAAEGGHEKIVRLLVRNHADLDTEDGTIIRAPSRPWRTSTTTTHEECDRWKREHGNAALHYAARRGDVGIVSTLVGAGANVNAFDKVGQMALHEAAKRGHEGVVRVLLDNGADLEAPGSEGEKPIHSAITGQKEAVVWLLIDRGAAVNAIDRWSDTALHYAAGEGMESVVKILLRNGGDVMAVDDQVQTVLHRAASGGNPAVVKILLDSGADSTAVDKFGCTALDVARRYDGKNREIFWVLLDLKVGYQRESRGPSSRNSGGSVDIDTESSSSGGK